MPKAITHNDVKMIAEMIRDWPKGQPFKWDLICLGAKSILGYEPTRQGLHKKPMLANAYDAKRRQLRAAAHKLENVTRPQTMLQAMERIARLEGENELLKTELQKMAEIANRFIYNSSLVGLSREQLMAALPKKG